MDHIGQADESLLKLSETDEAELAELAWLLREAELARVRKEEIHTMAAKAAEKGREWVRLKESAAKAIQAGRAEESDELLQSAELLIEEKRKLMDGVLGAIWGDLEHLARKHVYNDSDVKDVAQDAAKTIYQCIPAFDPARAQFRTWYYAITRCRAIDHIRKSQRWFKRSRLAAELAEEKPTTETQTEAHILEETLNKLSEDCRNRLLLLKRGDKNLRGLRQIAEQLREEYERSKKRTYGCIESAKRMFSLLASMETPGANEGI